MDSDASWQVPGPRGLLFGGSTPSPSFRIHPHPPLPGPWEDPARCFWGLGARSHPLVDRPTLPPPVRDLTPCASNHLRSRHLPPHGSSAPSLARWPLTLPLASPPPRALSAHREGLGWARVAGVLRGLGVVSVAHGHKVGLVWGSACHFWPPPPRGVSLAWWLVVPP